MELLTLVDAHARLVPPQPTLNQILEEPAGEAISAEYTAAPATPGTAFQAAHRLPPAELWTQIPVTARAEAHSTVPWTLMVVLADAGAAPAVHATLMTASTNATFRMQ